MRHVSWMTLCCACAATPAYAQSSVTLYGSLSTGVGYVSNLGGSHAFVAQQGILQADRWGMYGTEDLGGGLKTIFRLEAGFSTINGNASSAGSMFNRQAYVGLSDDTVGTLTLGQQADWNFEWLGPLSTAQIIGNFAAFHPGNVDGLAYTVPVQVSNAVKFRSRSIGGVTFGAMYSFSNVPGANTTAGYSLAVRYAGGPWQAAAAYSNYNHRPLNLAGGLGLSTFGGVALSPASAVIVDNVKIAGAGASYRLGKWTFHAVLTDARVALNQQRSHDTTWDGGVSYRLTHADDIGAGVWSMRFAGNRWTQFNLQEVHSLSKRTQLYAGVLYQRASSGANADMLGVGAAAGSTQVVVMSGMHHAF